MHCKDVNKSKRNIASTIHLHEWAPFSITSCHEPLASSPQLCVVMKAQLLNPSRDASSRRLANNVEVVIIGEVRYICISPRRLALSVIRAWTCSRYLTWWTVPSQPSVYNCTVIFPFIGIDLKIQFNHIKTYSLTEVFFVGKPASIWAASWENQQCGFQHKSGCTVAEAG